MLFPVDAILLVSVLGVLSNSESSKEDGKDVDATKGDLDRTESERSIVVSS